VIVKPYIPYDVIPSPYALPMARSAENQPLIQRPLTVPAWIVDSDISLRPVTFSPQASAFLESAVSRKFLQYVHSVSECVEFITQVTLSSLFLCYHFTNSLKTIPLLLILGAKTGCARSAPGTRRGYERGNSIRRRDTKGEEE